MNKINFCCAQDWTKEVACCKLCRRALLKEMTRRNWREGWAVPRILFWQLRGAASTGEFYKLPLAKNGRMFMYCGFGWKRSSCIWMKALRDKPREDSTHVEILSGYLQNRSQTHRWRKVSRDQMFIDDRLERSWITKYPSIYLKWIARTWFSVSEYTKRHWMVGTGNSTWDRITEFRNIHHVNMPA